MLWAEQYSTASEQMQWQQWLWDSSCSTVQPRKYGLYGIYNFCHLIFWFILHILQALTSNHKIICTNFIRMGHEVPCTNFYQSYVFWVIFFKVYTTFVIGFSAQILIFFAYPASIDKQLQNHSYFKYHSNGASSALHEFLSELGLLVIFHSNNWLMLRWTHQNTKELD